MVVPLVSTGTGNRLWHDLGAVGIGINHGGDERGRGRLTRWPKIGRKAYQPCQWPLAHGRPVAFVEPLLSITKSVPKPQFYYYNDGLSDEW